MRKIIVMSLLFLLVGCVPLVNVKFINNTGGIIKVVSLDNLLNQTKGDIISIAKGDSTSKARMSKWPKGSKLRDLPLFFYVAWMDTSIIDADIRSYNELKQDTFRVYLKNNPKIAEERIEWYMKVYLMKEKYIWKNDTSLTEEILKVALRMEKPEEIYSLMERDSIVKKALQDIYNDFKKGKINKWKFINESGNKLRIELSLERSVGTDKLISIYEEYRENYPY
ncbi:hypothetical protein KAW48_02965 [candidate division WOR-3 bacterium]|nr:hypothetical protein [candidate division WOR-3 bacterium]